MDVREKLVELLNNSFAEQYEKRGLLTAPHTATDLIAHGVTVQDWISVNDEQKPKDRRNYFIAYVFGDSNMHFFGEAMYHAYEGNGVVDRPHFSNEGVDEMRVTHWMEIPELPQPPKGD